MEFNRPTNIIPAPWAENGQYETIPATQVSSGRASWDTGFPLENTIPVSSGGIPANYNDFQGVLHDLSEHTCFQQTGGLYLWSSSIDYPVGAVVQGSDNGIYRALTKNGPNTVVANPVTDSSGKWTSFVMTDGNQTISGGLTVTSGISGTATDASSLGGIAASGYVTTSGAQAITGAKTFSGITTFSNDINQTNNIVLSGGDFVRRTTDDGWIRLSAASKANNGATLLMYGQTEASTPGYFYLTARDATYGRKDLYGAPDGTLVWAGSNVNTAAKPGVQLVEYTYNQSVTINADNALRVYFTPPTISGYTAQKVVNGRGNGILAFVVPSWSEANNAWVINVRASQQTANSMTFLIEYTRN